MNHSPLVEIVPEFLLQHGTDPVTTPLICPGLEFQLTIDGRQKRIPADRNELPEFAGELMTDDQFGRRVSLIGVTGWDWQRRLTLFIILDFDWTDHAAGYTDDKLAEVIAAARKLGWVWIRRSKGGKGIHLIVVLGEPMPAEFGKDHQNNAKAIVDRMCKDAEFDFRECMDCGGVVGYVWAREVAPNGFDVIVEPTCKPPVIETPAPELVESHPQVELTLQHLEDIDTIRAAGYVFIQDGNRWLCHSRGFPALNRPGYQTTSAGRNPGQPNAFAYPTAEGGWIVTRFGVQPASEAPCWRANAQGFATTHIEAPLDLTPSIVPTVPTIDISTNEKSVTDAVIAAMPGVDGIYQRAGSIVRISDTSPLPPGVLRAPNAPHIEPLTSAAIREVISRTCLLRKYDARSKKYVPCHVPQWLVAAVEARGSWALPTLEAISETPQVRKDGTIFDKPGYDRSTGSFLCSRCSFPIVDIDRAKLMLLGLVCDFPFAAECHRSAWLASLLTPFARLAAYPGPSPLFAIDANAPGVGKSLLADVTAVIATGRPMARMSAANDDSEWRKRITAIALAGESLILIDNINGTLGSASLDAALTGECWSDRLLGTNKTATMPLVTIWYATGNNLAIARDTARRSCHIRLDCQAERPEERTGFRHRDLLGYVREHRGELAGAALAILRGYFEAGRPDMGLVPWGSFEGWSALVRQSIVWLGLPDPGATRVALAEQSDTDIALLRQLLAGWQETDSAGIGMTAADAIESGNETLRAAVNELTGGASPKHALGLALRRYRGRVCGGRMFERIDRGKTKVWIAKQI